MNMTPFIKDDDIPKILKLCTLQINLKSSTEAERLARELQDSGYAIVKVTIEVNQGDNMDARRWETQLWN